MQGSELPQKRIGGYLKQRRERLNESLAEVSGAVEIDINELSEIESGNILPSEDILMLLLSHLDVEETAARKVLKLAGYDALQPDEVNGDEQLKQQMFVLMPGFQIQLADKVQVQKANSSVILNFYQPSITNTDMPIARVGLTKKQAKALISQLQAELNDQSLSSTKLLSQKTKKHHTK